jgi:predicted ATPase
MLVSSIDIREFRGVKALAKPLELRGFNVLVGRNNVGKTSILQALYLLSDQREPYGEEPQNLLIKSVGAPLVYGYAGRAEVSYSFGFKIAIENVTVSGEHSFNELSVDGLRLIISDNSVERRYRIASGAIHELAWNEYVTVQSSEGTTHAPLHRVVMERPSLGRRSLVLYIPNTTEAFNMLHNFVYNSFGDAVKRGLNVRVVREYLNRVVYDRFTEVFLGPRDELYARKEVGDSILYVRLKDFGEGVKRFTFAYLATEILNPALVLWDDIEVAMHPSLLHAVLTWLAESGRQVVITTHSIDALESVVMVEPRDAQIILLRKDGNDIVHHKTLEIDEAKDILEKNIDIRAVIEGVVE